MRTRSPLIIIGMHRSGTSLVTKVLEKSGIFMGVVKDHNYEAIHFLSLNQQSMYAAGGSWIEPVSPDKTFWKTIPARELYREHFRINTMEQRIINFFRMPRWGWKDPRNTFTLPMWLVLFPKAKVLHVYRDAGEVAKSLQNRNRIKGEVFDEKLNNLDFNLSLHRKYVEKARSYQALLGKRYHEVNYNELIAFNRKEIEALEDFCRCSIRKQLKKYVH